MKLNYCCNKSSKHYSKKINNPSRHYSSRSTNSSRSFNPNALASLSPVNFESANGSSTLVPKSFDPTGKPLETCPKTIACVTLDTSYLRSPQVIVNFTTEIHIKFASMQTMPASVEFELIKSNGCCASVVGTSTYSVLLNTSANNEIINSFSFNKILTSPCPGSCDTYCVRIVNPINNPAEISLFELRNPTISATAKSNCVRPR